MTDNEIKKALECCSEPAGKCCCEVCPLHHREDSCTTALIKMAVELTNRQQAEIERLQKNLDDKCDKCIARDRAEAIKEFAERVKQEINFPLAVWRVFDNLVIEMTESPTKIEHSSLCETESYEVKE